MCIKNHTLELTLAILKPHVIAAPYAWKDIQDKILQHGFHVVRSQVRSLSLTETQHFYKEHLGKFFFHRLVTFMSSGPVALHVLAREDAIQCWRRLLGPTKVFKAVHVEPFCIRALHGLTDTRNAVHGSDSMESAAREIKTFFPDFNIMEWYKHEETKVVNQNFRFDKSQFLHITNP